MDTENLSEVFLEFQKVDALEKAVLSCTPEELAKLYQEIGEVELSARALGYACRYKGLEYVRVLVENGASFFIANSVEIHEKYHCWGTNYSIGLLQFNNILNRSYFIHSGELDTRITELFNAGSGISKKVLPLDERLKILRYLYENKEQISFDAGDLLFYAMIGRNNEIAAELKKLGASFTDNMAEMLTKNSRSYMWQEYCGMLGGLDKEELFEFYTEIASEIGEDTTLHYTEGIYYATFRRIMEPDVFEFMLKRFNTSKINKSQILKDIIQRDKTDCLPIAENHGWLRQARKRDELIKFASDNGKTEATAWLLDFKNRTADLAAEQEKAEKKMMRELNASPDSVSELKKIWSYKKQEDGTLVITSYKGDKTEVTVPEMIGKCVVTAIGNYAFSTGAPHLSRDIVPRRAKIVKITLPDSIAVIGANAFAQCTALEEINIPDGVTELPFRMFSSCYSLKTVKIPDSVKTIGESAFAYCKALEEINFPDGIAEIPNGVFHACPSLKTVKIPASVRIMGNYVFSGCSKLKSVNLPDGITGIGNNMFGLCGSLERIDIPSSVTKIGAWAFQNCRSLKSVTVPEGVTEIGDRAFIACGSLETLELPASVKKIKNYKYHDQAPQTILDNTPNVTVTVPPKSYAEKYCKRNGIKYTFKES